MQFEDNSKMVVPLTWNIKLHILEVCGQIIVRESNKAKKKPGKALSTAGHFAQYPALKVAEHSFSACFCWYNI